MNCDLLKFVVVYLKSSDEYCEAKSSRDFFMGSRFDIICAGYYNITANTHTAADLAGFNGMEPHR